ncbi:hypothetical protein IW261DRAFT_1438632 [Armillaria novae-zelandiae]|uniref:Uncharacterized protein n=1 Tax=Armillaria novae-zelandiae TaxID=153914 RepID=A0AA39PXL7_9AGAR|nr:hypothetical protein IW261DRAFT_1438632 [Armillaria novae-zelandiae]
MGLSYHQCESLRFLGEKSTYFSVIYYCFQLLQLILYATFATRLLVCSITFEVLATFVVPFPDFAPLVVMFNGSETRVMDNRGRVGGNMQ